MNRALTAVTASAFWSDFHFNIGLVPHVLRLVHHEEWLRGTVRDPDPHGNGPGAG